MTGFDPALLQSMLQVFYPTPSPAALRVARLERPEYFKGATVDGAAPGELVLLDGRRVRCIDFVDGGAVAWRVRVCPTTSAMFQGH